MGHAVTHFRRGIVAAVGMIPSAPFDEQKNAVAFRGILAVAVILIASAILRGCDAQAQSRFVVQCDAGLWQRSLAWQVSQVGVTEKTGHNDGEPIETWQRAVGIHRGDPYCAAFQSYSFVVCSQTGEGLPFHPTPLANGIFSDCARHGTPSRGYAAGDLIVWKHANTTSGHIGRVVKILKDGFVRTCEANTSSGTGNQRDGDGVYLRTRNVRLPLSRMYLRGFVGRQ